MNLDFLVYPKPESSYSEEELNGEIIWIPKQSSTTSATSSSPSSGISLKEHHINTQGYSEDFTASRYKNFGSSCDSTTLGKSQQIIQMPVKNNDILQESISTKNNKNDCMINKHNLTLNCSNKSKDVIQQSQQIHQPADAATTAEDEDNFSILDNETFSIGSNVAKPSSISSYAFCSRITPHNSQKTISRIPTQEKAAKKNLTQQQSIITSSTKIEGYIPCIFLEAGIHSSNYLVYFHGNGEDANLSFDLLSHLRNNLDLNVIAMEYPGYGIYREYDKSRDLTESILNDAEILYEYLVQSLNIPQSRIILFGRSIGSGPATHLAAKYKPGALLLISPFKSLRQVAANIVGSVLAGIVRERFNNLENMKNVTSPTFLLHGQADKLVPYQHSMALFEVCEGTCEIALPVEMTHVEFEYFQDLSQPLIQFLLKNNYPLFSFSQSNKKLLPASLFNNPYKKINKQ